MRSTLKVESEFVIEKTDFRAFPNVFETNLNLKFFINQHL